MHAPYISTLHTYISDRICKVSPALYIDIRIDCLRRAVVLIGLFAIVVIFVLCPFYCIFIVFVQFIVSLVVFRLQFLNKLELS